MDDPDILTRLAEYTGIPTMWDCVDDCWMRVSGVHENACRQITPPIVKEAADEIRALRFERDALRIERESFMREAKSLSEEIHDLYLGVRHPEGYSRHKK